MAEMSFTGAFRDLNKLHTFVRIAQRRSFTKAATDLGTRPSVISKRMKELEGSLGFSLFNRSTHGLALTTAGEGLFEHCLQLLKDVDDYVTERRNLDAGPFGMLRVQAASEYVRFVLTPLIIEFSKSQPGVRVHVSVLSNGASSAEEASDIIISGQKPLLPGLVGRDLGVVEHVVCASPNYLKTFGCPKSPQDLRRHNCITDFYSGQKNWPFKTSSHGRMLVDVSGSLSSDSAAIQIQLALKSCGIIRVPLYAVKSEIADKKLTVILAKTSLSSERMSAYSAKAKHLPAKTAEFLGYLERSLRRKI